MKIKRITAIFLLFTLFTLSACSDEAPTQQPAQSENQPTAKATATTSNPVIEETSTTETSVVATETVIDEANVIATEPVVEEDAEVFLMDVCPPYSKQNFEEYFSGDYFNMAGEDYSNGFIFNHTMESVAYFNLKGEFNTMNLVLGMVSDDYMYDDVFVVSFIIDNKTVATYKMDRNVMPQEITIPLNYGKQLKICTSENYDMKVGFGEIKLKK